MPSCVTVMVVRMMSYMMRLRAWSAYNSGTMCH